MDKLYDGAHAVNNIEFPAMGCKIWQHLFKTPDNEIHTCEIEMFLPVPDGGRCEIDIGKVCEPALSDAGVVIAAVTPGVENRPVFSNPRFDLGYVEGDPQMGCQVVVKPVNIPFVLLLPVAPEKELPGGAPEDQPGVEHIDQLFQVKPAGIAPSGGCEVLPYSAVLHRTCRRSFKYGPLFLTVHEEIVNRGLQSHLVEHALNRCGLHRFSVDPFHGRERAIDSPSGTLYMRFRLILPATRPDKAPLWMGIIARGGGCENPITTLNLICNIPNDEKISDLILIVLGANY